MGVSWWGGLRLGNLGVLRDASVMLMLAVVLLLGLLQLLELLSCLGYLLNLRIN